MSGLLGDLTDEQLSGMTFEELNRLRDEAGPEMQKRIAPYEHQQFVRQLLREKPWLSPAMLVGTLGYQPAKAVGFVGARTPPSFDQLRRGLMGWAQGTKEGVSGLLGL
jgi:hypothetical protein